MIFKKLSVNEQLYTTD